ncbi:hypothetical protein TNCV_1805181 [Trichonephila clavipes]|nr:hypothetical protein TNCV_1805181 [Trichonephila clavipes]
MAEYEQLLSEFINLNGTFTKSRYLFFSAISADTSHRRNQKRYQISELVIPSHDFHTTPLVDFETNLTRSSTFFVELRLESRTGIEFTTRSCKLRP